MIPVSRPSGGRQLMLITFIHQALIGTRVHGVGETVEMSELEAKALIHGGIAEPAAEPDEVREATAFVVKEARRATKRGKHATRSPS